MERNRRRNVGSERKSWNTEQHLRYLHFKLGNLLRTREQMLKLLRKEINYTRIQIARAEGEKRANNSNVYYVRQVRTVGETPI